MRPSMIRRAQISSFKPTILDSTCGEHAFYTHCLNLQKKYPKKSTFFEHFSNSVNFHAPVIQYWGLGRTYLGPSYSKRFAHTANTRLRGPRKLYFCLQTVDGIATLISKNYSKFERIFLNFFIFSSPELLRFQSILHAINFQKSNSKTGRNGPVNRNKKHCCEVWFEWFSVSFKFLTTFHLWPKYV